MTQEKNKYSLVLYTEVCQELFTKGNTLTIGALRNLSLMNQKMVRSGDMFNSVFFFSVPFIEHIASFRNQLY